MPDRHKLFAPRRRQPYPETPPARGVEHLEASTEVYLAPEPVFEFLLDFPGYSAYSEYLRDVDRAGDGGPGTDYWLTFAWWRLTYTAHARVEAIDPPSRIDWRLVGGLDASGHWDIEPMPDTSHETASRVTLVVDVDTEAVDASVLDLPRFVSLSWVVERVRPKVEAEAQRVVRRVVADLEGQSRPVDVSVRTEGE